MTYCNSIAVPVRGSISTCLADISQWMSAHHLKLSLDKTELLFLPGKASPIHDLYINIENMVSLALPCYTTPQHPALATDGCSNPIQDTGTWLPCCEWLRILHPGPGPWTNYSSHPTLCYCQTACFSNTRKGAQLLLKKITTVLAPQWWNKLPIDIRLAETPLIFHHRLKIKLFRLHLGPWKWKKQNKKNPSIKLTWFLQLWGCIHMAECNRKLLWINLVPAQACGNWPIREDWDLWKGGLKETGTKTDCFRQTMSRGAAAIDCMRKMCFLNIQESTLVESQNESMNLKMDIICHL